MKAGQAFIGIMLEVKWEDLEQVRSFVKEWNVEYKRVLELGNDVSPNPTTGVTVLVEPATPVFAFDALMENLKTYALPGTLGVGSNQAPPLQEVKR